MKDARMELWMMSFKLILLFYTVGICYRAESTAGQWLTLFALLYISINTSIYLASGSVRLALILLSLALLAVSYSIVNPLVLMLVPINALELAYGAIKRLWTGAVFMLPPLYFVPSDEIIVYLFAGLLSFVFFTVLTGYADKLKRYRDEIDQMRSKLSGLQTRLNENKEHMRQSEHLYKLEERNRISQEIHDKIGHAMTGALIQMEAAKRLFETDKEKSAELLQNAIGISKDGIETIRLVLKNMKPLKEQLGINRLKLLIDEFSSKHAIKTVLTYEGNLDAIAPIHWKAIQENMMESLTNTMKYANATMVEIHIQVLNTLIKATVSDNGKGAPRVVKGLGVTGMEERAAELNGTVIVDGSRGFSVTTLIPYQS